MDKVDGAEQSWRVRRQGEQICVFIFLYAYEHCIGSYDGLMLAICDSAEK